MLCGGQCVKHFAAGPTNKPWALDHLRANNHGTAKATYRAIAQGTIGADKSDSPRVPPVAGQQPPPCVSHVSGWAQPGLGFPEPCGVLSHSWRHGKDQEGYGAAVELPRVTSSITGTLW